ncbi:MAG: cyclic nucleotide-binding protein [Rhodospirillaceae bacterium]|nr:MAG: cyclic nucleotide-binding protein [Rhodospirillaceae bacterium]
MEVRKLAVGEVVFTEGDPADNAFILKSGKVKITVQVKDETPRTLLTVGPGSIFGEMALIDDGPRTASVVVLEESEAMVISQTEFEARLKKSDPVIGLLLKIYTDRLREQTAQLAGLLS